jgi:8-oxo-dGTP pyrophosphatase MutT (NUDIX family)
MARPTISSGEAASELGIHKTTLLRWAHDGLVQPAWRTPKGQYRWIMADLERQLDQPAKGLADASRPQPQPVVAAVITGRRGVLAVQRNDGKPPWSFPAGESEPGEAPADTATREVKEETGLLINTGPVIFERLHPKTGRHMVYVSATAARGRDQDVHVGDPAELADVRWITLRQAEDLMPDMATPVWQYLAQRLSGQARGKRKSPPQLPYEAAS